MHHTTAIQIGNRLRSAGINPGFVRIETGRTDQFHVVVDLNRVVFIIKTNATEQDIRAIESLALGMQK